MQKMKFERTKNSVRNFVFGSLSRIVTIVFPFITRTLILYQLGAEYAGLSSVFTSVLSVLNVTELGVGAAIIFCLYKPVAEDNRELIGQLLSFIRKIYKIIGFFILTMGLCCMPFLKYIVKDDCPSDINLYVLFLIYLLNTSCSYFLFTYNEVLFNVYQRKDITHKILIAAQLIQYTIQILVLVFIPDYYLFTLAILITSVLNSVLIGVYKKRLFPDLVPAGKLSKTYTDIIKSKVKYLAANLISSTLVNAADTLVISASLGLFLVTAYGNYQYISSAIIGFLIVAYQSVTSSVGNSLVTESKEKNIKLFNTLWFIISWIIIWCTICLTCLYQPFITLWVGTEYLLDTPILILIVVFFFANATTQFFSTTYIYASGLWNKTVGFRIIASAVNLLLDFILVKYFNISGVIVASIIAYLLISAPVHIVVTYKYILHESSSKGFIKLIINIVFLAVFGGITYGLCSLLPGEGIIPFVGKIMICLIVPNLMGFVIFKKTQIFKSVLVYAKTLLIKK